MYLLKKIKNKVRWWYQRRTRGFDDASLWDLDIELGKIMLPRFKRYRELVKRTPARYYTNVLQAGTPKADKIARLKMNKEFDAVEKFLTILATEEDKYILNKNTKKWEYKKEYSKGSKAFLDVIDNTWF